MANSLNAAKALTRHGVMETEGLLYVIPWRIYSIDALFVCRHSSVICVVKAIRTIRRSSVACYIHISIKKRMKVHVVVDSTLESIIYSRNIGKVARSHPTDSEEYHVS